MHIGGGRELIDVLLLVIGEKWCVEYGYQTARHGPTVT